MDAEWDPDLGEAGSGREEMEETEEKEVDEYDVDSDVEDGRPLSSPVLLLFVVGIATGRERVAELTDEGGE